MESPEWGLHALTNKFLSNLPYSGDSALRMLIAAVARRTARGTLIVNTLYTIAHWLIGVVSHNPGCPKLQFLDVNIGR